MKSITLAWDKEHILSAARLELYYIGKRMKDTTDQPEAAALVQAGTDDNDQLGQLYDAAAHTLSTLFPDIQSLTFGNTTGMTILVPEAFDHSQEEPIQEAVGKLLTYRVIAGWLQATSPGYEAPYVALAEATRKELSWKLTRRIRPVLKPVFPLGF